jgi:hypothetical protein
VSRRGAWRWHLCGIFDLYREARSPYRPGIDPSMAIARDKIGLREAKQ